MLNLVLMMLILAKALYTYMRVVWCFKCAWLKDVYWTLQPIFQEDMWQFTIKKPMLTSQMIVFFVLLINSKLFFDFRAETAFCIRFEWRIVHSTYWVGSTHASTKHMKKIGVPECYFFCFCFIHKKQYCQKSNQNWGTIEQLIQILLLVKYKIYFKVFDIIHECGDWY